MPYIIAPKDESTIEHAWQEQQALWKEQYELWYHDLTDTIPNPREHVSAIPFQCDRNTWLVGAYPSFTDRAEALGALASVEHDRKCEALIFVPTLQQDRDWRAREHDRFLHAEYIHTPWKAHDLYPDHYVHLSRSKPGLVAYTQNAEHGVLDRQTAVKPGRYLEQYYKDRFSTAQIAQYIGQCGAEYTTLQITQDPAEIRTVYENGPRSCMGGLEDSSSKPKFHAWAHHPAEVYAGPDLAVAYYGSLEKPRARCVVWPEKKLYGRIYGSEEVMRSLLIESGYHHGWPYDAKVRKIYRSGNRLIMPYVDGIDTCSIHRDHCVLDNSGDYNCQQIDGYGIEDGRDRSTCDHCGDYYDAENEGGNDLCSHCYDNCQECGNCDYRTFDGDLTPVGDNYFCDSCADEYQRTCDVCSDTWYEENLSRAVRQHRSAAGETDLCVSCASHHETCEQCGDHFDTNDHSACPDCTTENEEETAEVSR